MLSFIFINAINNKDWFVIAGVIIQNIYHSYTWYVEGDLYYNRLIFSWKMQLLYEINHFETYITEILNNYRQVDATRPCYTLIQLTQPMARCRQATTITWFTVDPDSCRYIASLGYNELYRMRK